MRLAGLILCGGRSQRMGRSKALLPFGDEPLLTRVARLLAEAATPIAVAAAPGQELPPLPGQVLVARDERPGQGPLAGLAVGLRLLAPLAEAAYVTSCDAPLLAPAFVTRLAEQLGDHDVAVPVQGDFAHPLAGIYRVHLHRLAEALLASGQTRLGLLLERANTTRIEAESLRDVDPDLETLVNCNAPADHEAAWRKARARLREGDLPPL